VSDRVSRIVTYSEFANAGAFLYSRLKADHGGTNIANALDSAFGSLPSPLDRPVSIFLLTDGGQWDVQSCLTKVDQARKNLSTSTAYMRVFTVGIGDGVSTEMCDGIARVGNGASLYIVAPSQDYLKKSARLLRAARSPPFASVEVNWFAANTQPSNPPTTSSNPISLFQEDLEYEDEDAGAPVSFRQAPVRVQKFFPSTRTEIYAIVPKSKATRDSKLVLTFRVAITGESSSLEVPLQRMAPLGSFPRLHTLAAKAIITERELGHSENQELTAAQLKEEIIHLGLTHKLTSRHTSFLAVANGGQVVGQSDSTSASGLPHGLPVDVPQRVQPVSISLPAEAVQYSVQSVQWEPPAEAVPFSIQTVQWEPPAEASWSQDASIQSVGSRLGGMESFSPIASRAFHMETAEVLDTLVQMQNFDGGFGEKSTAVVQLLDGLGGRPAQEALARFDGIDDQVKAVALTWAWMRVCCDEEVIDIVEKLDLWLRANVSKSINVDELEHQVWESHGFGA
jgi:hypothetical protein